MAYIISSGITSDSLNIGSGDSVIVTDGGTVNNTTANLGDIFVSSGGVANITFINGGTFHIFDSGTASQTLLNGDEEYAGIMKVASGGSADAVMVNAYTDLYISSGGAVTDIIWTPTVGHVFAEDGAEAVFFSNYTGVYYGTGDQLLFSSASVDSHTVASGNELFVMPGGVANRTSVSESARTEVRGGTATNTTLYAGDLIVSSGGVATNTAVYAGDFTVSSGGVANNTTVYAGGLIVSSGGEANTVTVMNDGVIYISSGGAANAVTASDAGIVISSEGMINGFTIRGSGGLYAASYATMTGRMVLSDDATVFIEHSAKIDFNISNLTPGAAVRINNFSVFSGWESVDYTITISGTQANGTYSLAFDFPEFDQSISVVDTAGERLDELCVGETKEIGGEEFTLKVVSGTLCLQKGKSSDTPVRPDGADDGWNNWLYEKKKGPNAAVITAEPVALSAGVTEVCPDGGGEDGISYLENETTYHNFVGHDDEFDYVKISLEKAANLSFSLNATDASKFVIWKLTMTTDKKGVAKYTVKSLQSTALKNTKDNGIYYSAQSKSLLLEAGEYYISMQSTSKKKDVKNYYNIELEPENNTFFSDGDNSDDWTDLKTNGEDGEVGDVGALNADTASVVADEWVGFGDAVDYKKFMIGSAAKLSFAIEAADAVKFTVWRLDGKTDKKGVTTWSLKSLQSVKISKADANGGFAAVSSALLLDTGSYYLSVESTNAAKGASAAYSVSLNAADTLFFTDLDDRANNWLYDKKTKTPNPDENLFTQTEITVSTGEVLLDLEGSVAHEDAAGATWHNFVGYGDETDYAVIKLTSAANLVFHVTATDAAKFTVWSFTSTTDKKGVVKYTEKSLQATTLKKDKNAAVFEATTKSLSLAAGTYYISMTSTNASKGGAAYYRVELDKERSSNLPAAQDASALFSDFGPEAATDLNSLNAQDGFGRIPEAAASVLADLTDDLAPRSFANLA